MLKGDMSGEELWRQRWCTVVTSYCDGTNSVCRHVSTSTSKSVSKMRWNVWKVWEKWIVHRGWS